MTLLLKKLIFKNGFVGDITLSKKDEIFTKSLALFWMGILVRNVELLKTLTNNKRPPGVDPDGHSFVFLNDSINKKPIFFSEVVIFRTAAKCRVRMI